MQHQDIIFSGKRDELFIKAVRCHGRRRIVRVGNNHEAGPTGYSFRYFRQLDDIVIFFFLRHIVDFRPGQPRAIGKNRVAGVRCQYKIARIDNRQRNMREPFLRAQQGADFRPGIQCDTIAAAVPVTHRLQHTRLIPQRVEIVFRRKRRLRQSLHDRTGRRNVRRPDAQVDDRFPLLYLSPLHCCQTGKNSFTKLFHSLCKLQNNSPFLSHALRHAAKSMSACQPAQTPAADVSYLLYRIVCNVTSILTALFCYLLQHRIHLCL